MRHEDKFLIYWVRPGHLDGDGQCFYDDVVMVFAEDADERDGKQIVENQ